MLNQPRKAASGLGITAGRQYQEWWEEMGLGHVQVIAWES